MRTTTLLFTAGVLVTGMTGCTAPTSTPSTDGADPIGGKGDGWRWDTPAGTDGLSERVLDPVSVELDGDTLEGSFDPTRYEAYTFEVEDPARVVASFDWPVSTDLWNAWNQESRGPALYDASLLLFRLDEAALSEDPADRWDLVVQSKGDPGPSFADYIEPSLDYEIHSPGTFMVLVLASPASYDDAVSYYLTIGTVPDELEERAPGNVQLTLATDEGMPAAGIRAAMGTASGVTDEDGRVLLENVEAGHQLVKLGPDGLGRPMNYTTLRVQGDGATLTAIGWVDSRDYDAWRGPRAAAE